MNRKILFFLLLIFTGCSNTLNRTGETSNESKDISCINLTESEKRFCKTITKNKKRFDDFTREISDVKNLENSPYGKDEFVLYAHQGCKNNKQLKENLKECPFNNEKEYLNDWPPKIGLALSGGGTRSASFNIGVLKSLQEHGILEKIDVISSVSGGSYVSYWYFSHIFYMDKVSKYVPNANYDERNLFATSYDYGTTNLSDPDGYRFQRALEEGSDILAYTRDSSWISKLGVGVQYAVQSTAQALTIPVHWFTKGIFDWELNFTPFFHHYKEGVERAYGLVTLDYSLNNYANSKPFIVSNIYAEPIFLSDISNFLEEKNKSQKIPYFVINATGRFGSQFNKNPRNKIRKMEDTVFEFTPWGCHSTLLAVNKLHKCPKIFRFRSPSGFQEMDLSRIVTISGAALDGQAEQLDFAGHGRKSFEIFNKSWNSIWLDIANMNLGYSIPNPNSSLTHRILHKIVPWPFYLLDDFFSSEATSIYLSDGGHSDNLGIYPLIRRGVKHIIVADAEQDEDSIFEAAKRLINTLKKYGLELSFNQDEPLSVLYNKGKPVFTAKIFDNGKVERADPIPETKITYIKLSVAGRHNHINSTVNGGTDRKIEYPFTVNNYMENNPDFPVESTADVFYSPPQYKAYRDLGYTITNILCSDEEEYKKEFKDILELCTESSSQNHHH